MNKLLTTYLLTMLISISPKAYSQIVVDESNLTNYVTANGSLGFSTVEYTYQNDWSFEIERKMLGLGVNLPINRTVGLMLQAGYNFKSEYKDTDWKGKGWALGGGLNFMLHKGRKVEFLGYTLLNYIQEDYKLNGKLKADFEMTDLHVGGLVGINMAPNLSIYFGPDLTPYSEGEIKFNDKVKVDEIEREDIFNFKVGLRIEADQVLIRPEITFMNEQTFMLTVDF